MAHFRGGYVSFRECTHLETNHIPSKFTNSHLQMMFLFSQVGSGLVPCWDFFKRIIFFRSYFLDLEPITFRKIIPDPKYKYMMTLLNFKMKWIHSKKKGIKHINYCPLFLCPPPAWAWTWVKVTRSLRAGSWLCCLLRTCCPSHRCCDGKLYGDGGKLMEEKKQHVP